jgi:hypothetical protein
MSTRISCAATSTGALTGPVSEATGSNVGRNTGWPPRTQNIRDTENWFALLERTHQVQYISM